MKVKTADCSIEKILRDDATLDLSQIDRDEVERKFKQSGILLFRGFEPNVEKFQQFASQFSSQPIMSMGSAKSNEGSVNDVQLIVPHGFAQDLHQENGTLAIMPELLWFYCATPAKKKGQTTFADGTKIWQALKKETQEIFLAKRIKYTNHVLRSDWLTKDGFLDMRMHVGKLRLKGSRVRFDDEDTLIQEYITSAVSASKWDKELAFVNSLRGPYRHTVTFEDNSPIPDEIILEIDTVHENLIQEIAWQPGDMVVIDNTRYVHGRRAFRGKSRKHYTFMSLANF